MNVSLFIYEVFIPSWLTYGLVVVACVYQLCSLRQSAKTQNAAMDCLDYGPHQLYWCAARRDTADACNACCGGSTATVDGTFDIYGW